MILKKSAEIELMRAAGALLEEVHKAVAGAIKPGVTTLELDKIAFEKIISLGTKPAFLGYNGFPATINASINDVIVHGIPTKRVLKDGDIISIDCGLIYKGFFADAARTYAIGQVSDEAKKLIQTTQAALDAAIEAAKPGGRLGDISSAVQRTAEKSGFWAIREFVGHGIGRALHERPDVPNWGNPGKGIVLKPGLVLAIEPMLSVGKTKAIVLEDGWTAVTKDGSLAAQIEHTVAITADGPLILTL